MKLIKRLIVSVLIVGIIVCGFLVLEGYNRYKDAIHDMPLNVAVSNIENDPNYVPFEEIDEDFVNALVAIEDHRFFERKGIDIVAIGRAFVANMFNDGIAQGGSTITQQVAKNIYFSNRPSWTRKIAEVFFVWDLEDEYSKEEIFAMYANIIYYGDLHYGIKDASLGYFDKTPDDLTLYEASLLAGFPQSPSRYQLSNGYTLINRRQKLILEAMVENGYITQQQMDETLLLQPQE